jgi:hypothetical protein
VNEEDGIVYLEMVSEFGDPVLLSNSIKDVIADQMLLPLWRSTVLPAEKYKPRRPTRRRDERGRFI